MLAILSLLSERAQSVGEIIAAYPEYFMLKAQIPLTSPNIPELLMSLQSQYPNGKVNVQDGLRVDWPDRWFHVRVSQTEPVVRVICEQRGSPPAALFEALIEQVRSMS
jgi:phosphomannomutase